LLSSPGENEKRLKIMSKKIRELQQKDTKRGKNYNKPPQKQTNKTKIALKSMANHENKKKPQMWSC